MIELASVDRNAEVLRDTAYDTGGLFFHNSNDLEKGFRELNGFPEVFYILGFSPSNLKFDGHFHNLKVELVSPSHYLLQARRGYFAPKQPPDAALRAQEEIEDAVFSQQELNGLPVQINTQFFKNGDQQAKLSVLLYLDVRFLSFRKQEGRHLENLTVVTAVFDADGKIVNSIEKRVEMRLKDATLERLSRSGLSMKTSFDVKPGTYMIREVVRDAEGGQLSGVSRTIDIPF